MTKVLTPEQRKRKPQTEKPPGQGAGRGVGGGRALSEQKKEAQALVRDAAGMDPLEALAHIACGNCVALGWMTKNEAAGPRGRGRAWRMVPAGARIGAWTELAQYCHPKRKAIEAAPAASGGPSMSVTFVMPSNGREPGAAPAETAPGTEG